MNFITPRIHIIDSCFSNGCNGGDDYSRRAELELVFCEIFRSDIYLIVEQGCGGSVFQVFDRVEVEN